MSMVIKKNLEASEIRRKKGSETTPEILNIENIKAVLNFRKIFGV